MLMTAMMMNTLAGVSGVRVWGIPGMGDHGGDRNAAAITTTMSRRADRFQPPLGKWQCTSWQRGCIPLAATGGRQRRERATPTTAATINTLTGVSGVCVEQIPVKGDGENCRATVTMMMMSRRVDHIPPH